MAHITVPDQPTSTTFNVVSSQSVFSIPWTCFDKSDIQITVADLALTQADFTFVGNAGFEGGFNGGTITLNTAVANTQVIIFRSIIVQRTEDFGPGPVSARDRNTALDRLTAMIQDVKRVAGTGDGGGGGLYTTVASLTALRAETWPVSRPTTVQLVSNWTTGDGGGVFRWDGASTAPDNGGTIIKEAATTTGRWVRQNTYALRPQWFGARGDLRIFEGTATMAAGSDLLNQPGANFTASDIGRNAWVQYGGAGGAPLWSQIVAVNSATQCRLANPCVGALTASDCAIGSDDTAAILATVGAGEVIDFGSARYGVSSVITIGDGTPSTVSTRQNWILMGDKGGTHTNVLKNQQRCALKYIGTGTPNDMIAFAGPVRVNMSGIVFDGSLRVKHGSYNSHCFGSKFTDCYWIKNTEIGIVEVAYPYVSSFCFLGSSENNWENCHVASAGVTGFLGHQVGLAVVADGVGAALDVSRTSYTNCSWIVADDVNSIAMQMSYCDNLIFNNCFWLTIGERRGTSIKIVAPTGSSAALASYPLMIGINGGALVGKIVIDPLWRPDLAGGGNRGFHFTGMNDGDGSAPGYIGSTPLPDHYAFSGTMANGTIIGRRQLALAHVGETNYSVTALRRGTPNLGLSNSTAATNLLTVPLAAGTFAVRNAELNQGGLLWDRAVRLKYNGVFYNASGASTTLLIRVFLGSALVFDSGLMSMPNDSFYRAVKLDATLSPWLASPSTLQCDGRVMVANSGAAALAGAPFLTLEQYQTNVATNLSVLQNLIVQVTHGNANANIISFCNSFLLELI